MNDMLEKIKQIEKNCIKEIIVNKKYYLSATKYNDRLFFIVVHRIYFLCKKVRSVLK